MDDNWGAAPVSVWHLTRYLNKYGDMHFSDGDYIYHIRIGSDESGLLERVGWLIDAWDFETREHDFETVYYDSATDAIEDLILDSKDLNIFVRLDESGSPVTKIWKTVIKTNLGVPNGK